MRSTKFPHSNFRSFLCLITIMPKSASLNFLYSLKIPTHCCFDLTHTTPYPPKGKKNRVKITIQPLYYGSISLPLVAK